MLAASLTFSQAPTGSISGTVRDPSGAVMPSIRVTVTSKATGATRQMLTWEGGTFGAPSLPAGQYQVKAEASGFRTMVRDATVETGATTTVDLVMQVGAPADVVSVEGTAAQIEYERHTIDGVVQRQYIENLPLNGRSFLQLASVEPGVTVSPGNVGQYNKQFDVSILGGSSDTIRITVDGATVNDSVTGGTQQNFSQEVVQEFQVSIANYDLSTGITGSGAINVVTRSGSNDFHGSGFFFFRDHNMSAYPYLRRDPLNPDPFFARRQPGLYVGGPVKKDKLFFFANYEHNNQAGVVSTIPSNPEFAAFGANASTPYRANLAGARMDYRINDRHNVFIRYSHDGNNAYAPSGGGTQPSNWAVNTNYADSGVFSLISSLKPSVVNEFRYSMTYWSNSKNPPTADICPAPCFGLGGPQINLYGIDNFQIGNDANNTPQSRVLRRHIFADNMTVQHGSHRFRFGGEYEYQKGTGTYDYADPAGVTLYSPDIVRYFNSQVPSELQLPLPSSFTTLQDILQLPVAGFATGIGDITQPPAFQRSRADHNNRFHFYGQDTWRIRPGFTLNFGLAWSYETNLLNYDLPKPQYLAPLAGSGGLTEKRMPRNFTPMLGFAWNVGKNNKTVIRGGAGVYYDTLDLEVRLLERAAIGPLGTGRVLLYDSVFLPNILPVAVPPLASLFLPPLNSLSERPTPFTGAIFEQMLPQLKAGAEQLLGTNPSNTDLSIRNINVFKTAPGLDLFDPGFRTPYTEQATIGIQRELGRDLVLSADFVYQLRLHQIIRNTDLNHYDSAAGPIIPKCQGAQALDPAAQCSTGRVDFDVSGATSRYKGLLVKLDKRLSHRYLFTMSYSYNDRWGYNGLINELRWSASNGPQQGHHLLNLSGVVDLPWGFQISMISTFQSRGPFQPMIAGIDLDGNGDNGVPIPGGGYNEFAISRGKSDLVRLVGQFNQNYAGQTTSRGQAIPALSLPASFDFGRNFNSQDFRVTKFFNLGGERYRLSVLGEVFNAFNIANLGGYSNDLTNPGFGQPTTRTSNIFGSGGPRAFQVGARFTF